MQNQPTPDATIQVKAHFVTIGAGHEINFTTSDGGYLGSIQYQAMTREAIAAMANFFQAWAAEQAGGIQIATGELPGVRA